MGGEPWGNEERFAVSSLDFTDGFVRSTIRILVGFDIKFCIRFSYCQVSFIYERF